MGFRQDTPFDNSSKTRPLVSVVLPVYNGGAYLWESIQSILSQTYDNFELIIIDDGSTDGSASNIEKFQDARIRFQRQANKGLPATLNVAIAMSHGEYVARQDADDVSHPTRLEKQVAFLGSNPDCGMVGTWSEILEEERNTARAHRHLTGGPALAFGLLFNSYFVHSSVMLRRSVLSAVGLYCVERSRQPEDYELWSRILRNSSFKFANIPEQLVYYREVAQSICRSGVIDFSERVSALCAENLAWACDLVEPDRTCLDIAALLHNTPGRVSSRPDLDTMLKHLRQALCRVAGAAAASDRELMLEFDRVLKAVRNQYLIHRYGTTVGRALAVLSDLTGKGSTAEIASLSRYGAAFPAGQVGNAGKGDPGAVGSDLGVDVVIPVYNGERFIRQALLSVVSQTHPPKKIIVVDDGSTDRTREVVSSLESEIPILYLAKEKGGPSSARNVGIASCDSDFIAFLDADDEWHPEKLEEQVDLFRSNDQGSLGVVYSKYAIIDENGARCDGHFVLELDETLRGRVFEKLLAGNAICGSCSGVLVKRQCLERVGLFDETFSNCEDWDLWLRIAELYEFDFVPRELVLVRRHPGNNQNDTLRMFNSRMLFLNKWISRLPHHAECFALWRRLCITYVVAQKPRARFYAAITSNLSAENRRKFFGPSFGCVPLYLVCTLPKILLGMLKHRICAAR